MSLPAAIWLFVAVDDADCDSAFAFSSTVHGMAAPLKRIGLLDQRVRLDGVTQQSPRGKADPGSSEHMAGCSAEIGVAPEPSAILPHVPEVRCSLKPRLGHQSPDQQNAPERQTNYDCNDG
jgi:hypothetical protein